MPLHNHDPSPESIRLVACDVDGTLANPAGEISPYTRQVLCTLHSHGIEVALVTGLNPWVVRRYITAIGPWMLAISLNGTFALRDDTITDRLLLDIDVARQATEVIVREGYVPLVFGEDLITRYLPASEEGMQEVRRLMEERPYQPYQQVDQGTELFSVLPAQVSVCETLERAERLYPLLAHTLGTKAYVVLQPGPRSWVEVNHPRAHKHEALLHLAHHLGIDAQGVLYFGDNLNDLPVFERLPYTVAMANARPEVKARAWRHAPSNAEDGVARFLAHFFALEGDALPCRAG